MDKLASIILLVMIITSCASTSTQSVYLDPEKVKQETKIQKELALRKQIQYQERLRSVAYPILKNNSELCPDDISSSLGVLWSSVTDYSQDYQEAASILLGVGEYLLITRVEPNSAAYKNGILRGDKVISINGRFVGGTKREREKFLKNLNKELKENTYDQVTVQVERGGSMINSKFFPDKICNFPVLLSDTDDVNAYANGVSVIVTKGMIRFVENDTELGLVIAHELGHNVMNHLDKQRKNYLLGSIFDIAAAAYGVNTQGAFGNAAAQVYSKEFEAEADYVGLYYLYRADYTVDNAAYFWRSLASEYPGSIRKNHAASHPATPERFVAIESTVLEINAKKQNKKLIIPDFKEDLDQSEVVNLKEETKKEEIKSKEIKDSDEESKTIEATVEDKKIKDLQKQIEELREQKKLKSTEEAARIAAERKVMEEELAKKREEEERQKKITQLQKQIEELKETGLDLHESEKEETKTRPKEVTTNTTAKSSIVKPKLIHNVVPDYSRDLRAKELVGEVIIKFDIGISGRVENAFILESSGHVELDLIALESVEELLYSPALVNGVPEATAGKKKRFSFTLDD